MSSFKPTGKLAESIFKERYAAYEGESWEDACLRVARHVAAAEPETNLDNHTVRDVWTWRFEKEIADGRFMPGGRIWYGSGRPQGQLLNCFIVPSEDSIEGWARTVGDVMVITAKGGGVGVNLSNVRGRGAHIKGTNGHSTGAVSLAEMINMNGEVISGGGGRRLALMLDLDITHPDMPEFLDAKLEQGRLENANISLVLSTNPTEFVRKVREGDSIALEFNGKPTGDTINARELMKRIVKNAWTNGEPGILNGWLANQQNNIGYYKPLVSTNPSMPAGTLVGTRDGIFPIEQLEGKDFRVKSLDGTWADAKCFLSGENEPVLEISFGASRVTQSTKQHRWPVWDKRMGRVYKVYAEDLKPGDLIPLNRNELTGMQGDVSLTEEEGFFLGYTFGDGWVSCSTDRLAMGAIFPPSEYGIANRVLDFANTHKEKASTLTLDRDGNSIFQTTNQKFIERYAYVDGKDCVPAKVWTSNDNFIRGFVDGLFSADGHVSEVGSENPVIDFVTSRKQVAIDVAKLLSFYGIPTTLSGGEDHTSAFPNGKDYGKQYERWSVRISRGAIQSFAKVFDISHPEKGEKLAELLKREYRTHDRRAFAEVQSIREVGSARVWDISVDHVQHVFPSQYAYTGNCGEIWLEEYGCCCLGSVVLPRFVKDGKFDWNAFRETVRVGVRFLDNVLTVNKYPLDIIRENCEEVRRLGLGVMGVHNMLLELGMKYSSPEAIAFLDELFNDMKLTSYRTSIDLAVEKGAFAKFDPAMADSGYCSTLPDKIRAEIRKKGIRNCALLTIAPTGTTSLVQGVSSGIEPLYAPVHIRTWWEEQKDGSKKFKRELVIDPMFEKYPDLCEGAMDLSPSAHFEVQRVAQKHIDNAVSKTINLPQDISEEELMEVWLRYLPYCKGTTLFREGSRVAYDDAGNAYTPLTPVPRENLEAAKREYGFLIEDDLETQSLMGCPDGVCSLDHRPVTNVA